MQLLASLGKSNFSHLAKIDTADKIVLVLDNDKKNWQTDNAICQAISNLKEQGKQVYCMQPALLNKAKTDYNDLVQAKQFDLIKQDLQKAVCFFKNEDRQNAPKPHFSIVTQQKQQILTISKDKEIYA